MTWWYVALGAALGAPLRFLAGRALDARLPWGTVAVNVAGSFLLGLFMTLPLTEEILSFLGAGFCGALTTYSAFAVQAHARGRRLGVTVVLLTILPALALCALGHALGRVLAG